MAGQKLQSVKGKSEILNFKIDAPTANQFKELVGKEGLTASQVLRFMVERFVKLKGSPTVKQ